MKIVKTKRLVRGNSIAAVVLLAGFAVGFFCPGSASATTSYLNVSSGAGAKLSFGKVRPDDTGVSATTSDNLTINTNCTAGYSVYVSAQSDKGTDLVNKNPRATVNNTIATSSAAIGSATALANNTWGISATEGDTYVGLPTYANALNTPLTIMSDVAEQTTVPIYYGLKVDTTLAPGIYSGDILYTVLSDPACASYIIHFNSNGGTGDMSNQTVPVGTATPLDTNTFTRTDYNFLGWSTSATGKTGTAVNGIGTAADVDYTDGQSITDISDFNTTLELYAIWEPLAPAMQDWNDDGTACAALSEGQQVLLRDTRDNRNYTVKKLPDGKCWMTQNLTIGMDGAKTLTPADTNIDDGKTYYLPPAGKQGSSTIDNSSTLTATDTADFGTSNDNRAKTQFRTKDTSITNDSDTGYYNFYTATLGFSYYSDGKTSGSSTRDICPKGWRLPKTPNATTGQVSSIGSDNDFTYLVRQYSTSDWNGSSTGSGSSSYYTTNSTAKNSMYLSAASPLTTSTQNNYAGFSYAGYWNSTNASASDVGSRGLYWSSSVYNAYNGYSLRFGSSDIYPQYYYYKSYGYAVRCVAKEPTPTMQDFDASTSLPNVGDQMELEDARDGKKYTVKRLPDGKVWMTQNLALGMNATTTGLTLTSADTNIDNGTTYYLPPAGKQGSSTIDQSSTLTATDTANFANNSSTDQHAKTQFRAKDDSVTNDSDTGYYNFYTATLGFSYLTDGKTSGSSTRDICPKGWRLPKTTDSGATVSTTGTANDFTNLVRTYSTSDWSGAATSYDYYTTNSAAHTGIHTGLAAAGNNYAGFSYAGYYNNTSQNSGSVGFDGRYWSSSVYATNASHYLYFDSSGVYPQQPYYKYYGLAVRCIANEPTMQDFDSTTSLPNVGDQAELMDTRDGKKYTVKRLPDGKVWMTQNLAIGMDGAKTLTSADTNIDNGTTYYLPPAGKQGSSTIDDYSTLTATTTADFNSTSNDNRAKTQFRTKDSSIANDSDTGYYNFYTATLGYSYYDDGKTSGSSTRDICPKGWRLPKTTDSGTTVSTTGTANDFTYLATRYNTSASWTNAATSSYYYTQDTAIYTGIHTGLAAAGNNYAGFSYASNYIDTSQDDIGSRGYYWSSSIYNTNYGYILLFEFSSVRPQFDDSKDSGNAVRCIAKN